ncbi:MAG: divalent cation transporter [Gammaproteobacteria bacterium]|nr:divalent cation transporter [Gammaproteobacteria bacterium]
MGDVATIVFYTTLAGACVPLGGLLANFEQLLPRWLDLEFRHFVIAFGGGILIAAVATVLVPEGTHFLDDSPYAVLILLAGGAVFMGIERWLASRQTETPQVMALLLDYAPEALALGGLFASGSRTAPLLAVFIGLQNLPEGFNAYRELCDQLKHNKLKVALIMLAMVPIGPALALLGWAVLSDYQAFLGGIMLFAAGGILYLIFQDLAPQSKLQRHWLPALGGVCGFGLGLFGHLMIG